MRFMVKLFISSALIALASEVAKRYPKLGGLIVSLPLTSILSILWLYVDTKDDSKILKFSWSIMLFLLPSIVFFLSLLLFLKMKFNFYLSFVLSIVLTMLAYHLYYKIVTL